MQGFRLYVPCCRSPTCARLCVCAPVLGGGRRAQVPPFEIRHATLGTAHLLQRAAFHGGVWLKETPFPHLPRARRKSAWLLQISVYPSIHMCPSSYLSTSVHLDICLAIYAYLSLSIPIYPYLSLSIHLDIHLSTSIHIYPSRQG